MSIVCVANSDDRFFLSIVCEANSDDWRKYSFVTELEMLSTEFPLYFNDLKDFYLGCFSSDNYPDHLKPCDFFIVNKDSSKEKGSHWMLVILSGKNIEFFDSCGTSEEFVKKFLKLNKKYVCVYNTSPVQPTVSSSCGEFCIYFAHKRLLNKDLSFGKVINRIFTSDQDKNNKKVLEFCKDLFFQSK